MTNFLGAFDFSVESFQKFMQENPDIANQVANAPRSPAASSSSENVGAPKAPVTLKQAAAQRTLLMIKGVADLGRLASSQYDKIKESERHVSTSCYDCHDQLQQSKT